MKKLLILSGKGGTGKTTVAASFIEFLSARAFADCDVDAPNLHLVADIDGEPERTDYYGSQKAVIDPAKCVGCGLCLENCRFDAVAQKDVRCEINEYACEGCGVCQYVCPQNAVTMQDDIAGEQTLYCGARTFSTAKLKMGRGNSGKLVSAVKSALLQNAEADVAIIDGSPGIGCPVIASISGVDMVLIVAEPSLSGVNKADVCPEKAAMVERFCAENAIPFAGSIPYDKAAAEAINSGRSLAAVDCPARNAIHAIYRNTMKLLKA